MRDQGSGLSSTPIEPQTMQLSDSEELDVISANAKDTEDSPPQSRAYEELGLWQERLRDWVSIGQQRGRTFVQKADLTKAEVWRS